MRWIFTLALALGALGGAMPAQSNSAPGSLQRLTEQLGEQNLLRGAYAVQRGERLELEQRIGAAPPQPAQRIGSVSKLFTATLILQLVDEGRLRMDTPLAQFFPQLPNAQLITLEMLLRHRSGLGDLKHAPNFDTWARQRRSNAEVQALIESLPVQGTPGQQKVYNNSAFILLHWIAERASGQSFAQLLQQRIAAPLGLQHTELLPDTAPPPSFERSTDGRWLPLPSTHPSVPLGAGAMLSTPAELTRFIRALFKGPLLRPATRQAMSTLADGMGLSLYPLPNGGPWQGQGLGHEGVIDGAQSVLVYFPQHDLALALLCEGVAWPRDALLAELIGHALNPAQRSPDLTPQPQRLALQASGMALQSGERLALRGSQAPLRWDRGLGFDGTQLNLVWNAVAGLPLEAKLVVENEKGEALRWEKGGNRIWPAGQAPGLLRFDLTDDRLWREIEAADAALFAAFNQRDASALAGFFSERLEFFHDLGGLSGKEQTMKNFSHNFGRSDLKLRRELVAGSLKVYPLPGIGAMQTGQHRFCRLEGGSTVEQCATFGFSQVWEKSAAGWQLLRVLSYGH